jgi:hypothetical protein
MKANSRRLPLAMAVSLFLSLLTGVAVPAAETEAFTIGSADEAIEAAANPAANAGAAGKKDAAAGVYRNPLVQNIADPRIMRASTDGRYYLYPTGWKVYSSPDLVHWEDHGPALREEDIAWRGSVEPADPGALEHNGKFYLFYSFRVPNVRYYGSVAESSSPLGPFVDNAPHPSYDFGISMLDPMVFKDDDGRLYLYYSWNLAPVGNHRESRIYGVELSNDLRTPIGEPVLLLKPDQSWEGACEPNCPDGAQRWNEAPYMVKHNGTYYLTYSANCYCNKNYAVGYATSQHPLGPFVKYENNPILSANYAGVSGTGRSSLIQSPDGTEWFMAYHSHIDPVQGGAPRQLNIDRMGFRKDGTMYVNGPTLTEQPMPSGTSGWRNIAKDAKITVSSTKPGFSAEALVDGEIGIYAKNSKYDWVTDGETAGAWVKLEWDKNTEVDSIWIYDSAAPQRMLKSGKVTISHGNNTTTVEFPREPGAAAVVRVDGKKIKWMKFEVLETLLNSNDPVEIDDLDPAVFYSDGWNQATATSLATARNNTLMQTNVAGASAEVTFSGTWVEFYSRTGNQAGIADIYIDGIKAATVDLYNNSQRVSGVKVFEKRDLPPGEHTFAIVNSGNKNSASGGTYVFFDALVHEGGLQIPETGLSEIVVLGK